MNFTKNEIATINAAKKKVKNATIVRAMIIIIMLIALVGMFTGPFIVDHVAYFMMALLCLVLHNPSLVLHPSMKI